MSTAIEQKIPQGTWNVDASHSSVEFQVKHMAIATVKGFFDEFEGTIEIGDTPEATKAYGKVKAHSVNTREAKRDDHLRSPDFFDAERHPELTFQSTKIEAADEDTYRISGDLTIHGVTKPVELEAEVSGADEDPWGGTRIALDVTTSIKRSDYGMEFNQALGSGNMLVGDKIKIVLSLSTVKAS